MSEYIKTVNYWRRKVVEAVLQAVRLKNLGYCIDNEGRNVIYSINDAADLAEYYERVAMQEGLHLLRYVSSRNTDGTDEEE